MLSNTNENKISASKKGQFPSEQKNIASSVSLMSIVELREFLEEVTEKVENHQVFKEIQTIDDLKTFMENHCFAVWDFMSLLKRLQNDLTCVTIPWTPAHNPKLTRLINEIVTGEESDETKEKSTYIDHYSMYLGAMRQVGASTKNIESFVRKVQKAGTNLEQVFAIIDEPIVPHAMKDFVKFTLNTAVHGETPEVLGSFFYGRESIIPHMFHKIVKHIGLKKKNCDQFMYYVIRHIELDGDAHGPAAKKMINIMYKYDEEAQRKLLTSSIASVEARLKMWDGVLQEIYEDR